MAGDRPQPLLDPLGVQLGSFLARADGDVSFGYNSNLYGRDSKVVGDGYSRFSPSLRLTSGWGRHAVELGAGAEFTRFMKEKSQNTDEYNAHLGGELELGDRVKIRPGLDYGRSVEARGTTGNRFVAGDPIYARVLKGSITGSYEGGDFSGELTVAARRERYEPVRINGELLDQDIRDTDGVGARASLLYKVSPSVSALVQAVVDESTNPHSRFCCFRDAHGYKLLAGVRLDPAGLIAGQVALGYRQRFFEGPGTSAHGFTYDAKLQWYPSELITLTFGASQQDRNSGILAANAVLVSTQSVGAIWEMYRDLNISLQAEHEHDAYHEVDAATDLTAISLRATYTARRLLQLSAFGRYVVNTSDRSALATRYDALRAGFSLRVRM